MSHLQVDKKGTNNYCRGYAFCTTGFTTAPDRMQRVQTRICLELPPTVATRTFCRLGSQRRLVLLWAWLTLFPVTGFLPQISHNLDIIILL